MISLRDLFNLIILGGFSAVIFMGFWLAWLKTKQPGFKLLAYWLGLLPVGLSVLVVIVRLTLTTGTVHQFEAVAPGPKAGEEAVVRELSFPVEDAELRHVIEVRPALAEVGVKDTNGELVEVTRSDLEGAVAIEFDAARGGAHLAVLKIPEGVEKVALTVKEIR